jgi:hypothetical protein
LATESILEDVDVVSNRRFGLVVMLLALNVGLFIEPTAAQQPLGMVAHDY